MGSPGSRLHVAGFQKIYVSQYGTVRWGADSGMCAAAALFHMIDAVCRRSMILHYCNRLLKLRPSIDSLSGMSEVFRQMKKHVPTHLYELVELQKVKK